MIIKNIELAKELKNKSAESWSMAERLNLASPAKKTEKKEKNERKTH
jgi:hypothetical protein